MGGGGRHKLDKDWSRPEVCSQRVSVSTSTNGGYSGFNGYLDCSLVFESLALS